jgi:hypothetical protein
VRDRDRRSAGGLQAGGEHPSRGGVRHVLAQHPELVAAEPGDGVLRPDGAGEALRRDREEVVARGVAEAVVDGLEVVEVQQHQGDAGGVLAGDRSALEGVLEPVEEQRADSPAR